LSNHVGVHRGARPPSSPTRRSSGALRQIGGRPYWRGRIGFGAIKEIGWGLRPQIRVDLARQINDGPLTPFAKRRQDWLLEGSLSIFKRDWNVEGFAPSVSVTATRNFSTLSLYDERRLRGEVRLTKAF
jgi:hypothetical protein